MDTSTSKTYDALLPRKYVMECAYETPSNIISVVIYQLKLDFRMVLFTSHGSR